MNRRGTVFALAIAAGLWWGVGAGRADQDANLARGFTPGKLYDHSGLDSVNLHNGALTLTLPIGPRYPVGDQFSYGLTLSYGSNVWDPMVRRPNDGPHHVVMLPRRSSDAGLGWMLSLGGQLYGPAHPSEAPMQSAGYQFESEDGSIHVFHFSLHRNETAPDPPPGTEPCRFTRDNTYLRLCGSGNTRTIEFPDGTKRTYTRLPTFEEMRPWDVDRYRLTRMEDRFGNWVDVAYGGGVWTITDSLDRSHTASFHFETVDGEQMWVLDFVDLQGFGGARSRRGGRSRRSAPPAAGTTSCCSRCRRCWACSWRRRWPAGSTWRRPRRAKRARRGSTRPELH